MNIPEQLRDMAETRKLSGRHDDADYLIICARMIELSDKCKDLELTILSKNHYISILEQNQEIDLR